MALLYLLLQNLSPTLPSNTEAAKYTYLTKFCQQKLQAAVSRQSRPLSISTTFETSTRQPSLCRARCASWNVLPRFCQGWRWQQCGPDMYCRIFVCHMSAGWSWLCPLWRGTSFLHLAHTCSSVQSLLIDSKKCKFSKSLWKESDGNVALLMKLYVYINSTVSHDNAVFSQKYLETWMWISLVSFSSISYLQLVASPWWIAHTVLLCVTPGLPSIWEILRWKRRQGWWLHKKK